METYHRRRLRNSIISQNKKNEMMTLKGQDQTVFMDSNQQMVPPPLARPLLLLQTNDKHVEVGSVYEINHANLPIRTPVQLRSIRVVTVTEKTELSVSVRYPSIGSLCSYLSNNKICRLDIYPFLVEMFVMGTQLAGNVLCRKIPSQEFDDNKHLEGFWLVKSSGSIVAHQDVIMSSDKEISTTPLMSQLKSNGMVRWGIRRQVKFLNKHGESSTSHPQSSSSIVKEDHNYKNDDDDGEEEEKDDDDDDEEEEEEEKDDDADEEEEEEKDDNENLKRKRYCFRNNRKAKKVEREIKKEHGNKKSKKACKAIVLNNSNSRWSAQRYKLAEEHLLGVMKAKEAVCGKPILRPALRLEARKHIGDTGLLDHLLKHMAGKIAPGGTERFRRRHNADGQMEYWLESADLVNIRKEAGVQDPYWIPPPGWTPGDCPSQDPICAMEFKLLKEENSKLRREMEEMVSKKQLKEELENLRREIMDEHSTEKRPEESLAIQDKPGEQLIDLPDFLRGMKEEMGKLNSKVECLAKLNAAAASSSGTKEHGGEKEKKQATSAVAVVLAKEAVVSAGGGDDQGNTAAAAEIVQTPQAAAKAAKIQRLKSGFRICKPQGTFLWPNMVARNHTTTATCSMLSPQVVVQVDQDLFHVVPTPPSVSSSTASAPPKLPYHHRHNRPPTSPVKPVPERRAVTVTVSTGGGPYDQDGKISTTYSTTTTTTTTTTKSRSNNTTTTLINLNDIPIPDETTPASQQTVTMPRLVASMVKREVIPTTSASAAWECVGNSSKGAISTGRRQQQRESSYSSTTSALSTDPFGPWLALTSPTSAGSYDSNPRRAFSSLS